MPYDDVLKLPILRAVVDGLDNVPLTKVI